MSAHTTLVRPPSITEREAAAPSNATTRTSRRATLVFPCVSCSRVLRWMGRESTQVTCPHCGTRMVLLIESDLTYSVLPDGEASIAEMITHWLASDRYALEHPQEDDYTDQDE